MLSPGQIVGSYRITRPLGQGGMGAVYAAEHQVIGRRAAIKVLHQSLSSDPALASRFLNEARAVNLVEHPGLVEVYEYGVLPEGGAYIVMEYLEGETLHAARRRHGRLTQEAAAIGLQIAEALAAAHARDIIHRDLKPDNVMLVRDRGNPRQLRVKILDFGIAKLVPPAGSAGNAPLTGTGVAVGTPEYMSPEQCKGHPVDGRSDCYSLGVLLYELLLGHRPYEAEFAFDVMRMHVHGPVPTLSPDVPAPLRALCERLLAKEPAQRPTMAEVVEQLTPLARPLFGQPGGAIGVLTTAEWSAGPSGSQGPVAASGPTAPSAPLIASGPNDRRGAAAIGSATPSAAVLPTLPAGSASLPAGLQPGPQAPAPQAASAGSVNPGSLFAASSVGSTMRRPRTPLRSALLGVGAAIFLVGGGLFALRDSRQPPGDPPRAVSQPPAPTPPAPTPPAPAPPAPTPVTRPAPAFKEIPGGDDTHAEGRDGGVAAAKSEAGDKRKVRGPKRGARPPEAAPDTAGKPQSEGGFKDF